MTQVVQKYRYEYGGVSHRAETRRRLKEQALRNIEAMTGQVRNGYVIDDVHVDDRTSLYPRIIVCGHTANKELTNVAIATDEQQEVPDGRA